MATPRALNDYPETFRKLFFKALHEPVIVACLNHDAAQAYRGRLYAFRTAVMEEMERDPELALIAPQITMTVDTRNLIISYKEPQHATN